MYLFKVFFEHNKHISQQGRLIYCNTSSFFKTTINTFADTRLEEVGLPAGYMQPNPWDDLTAETGEQQILIDGQPAQISTGFGNQIIMLQPPSSAAKIIGILLIIYGAFNAVALLLSLVGFANEEIRAEQGLSTLDIVLNLVSGFVAIGTAILGGIWMMNYKRKGVHLVLLGIFIGFLLSIAVSLTGSTDVAAQDLDLNENAVSALVVGISAVCNAVCALIVAIPLMVSNNGLDDSKLFG